MKSMLQNTQKKSSATAKSRSMRDSFCQAASSCWVRPAGLCPYHIRLLGKPLCSRSSVDNILHTLLFLIRSSSSSTYYYCFHPLLVSTFSATFWVNCDRPTVNWLFVLFNFNHIIRNKCKLFWVVVCKQCCSCV